MSANKYLEYGIDELESIISELQAQSPINTNELIAARNALSEKRYDAGTPEPQPEQVKRYEFIEKIDFDEYDKTESGLLNSIVQSLLNALRSQYELQLAEKDAQFSEQLDTINGQDSIITNLNYQNKSLQETVSELSNYKLNNEDYKARFEASTAKMNEYEQEIERLKRRESELQQQLANAPAPTVRQPIDITADTDINALIAQAKEKKAQKAAEEEAARKASLTKVTNLRWEDPYNRKNYLAELVTDGPEGNAGKTITINYLYLGKYVEVSAEEAERFRAEAAAASQEAIVESSPLVETPEIVTVEQFREEDTVRHDEGMDASPVGEVASEKLTIEQRVQALERAVFGAA